MIRARILLVDDHTAFLDGLHAALTMFPHIEIAGTARSFSEAIAKLSEPSFTADIILTDYSIGAEHDGIELCKEVKRLRQELRVVLLTMHNSNALRFRAERAGVDHYLEKTIPIEQIVEQLDIVMRGDRPRLIQHNGEHGVAAGDGSAVDTTHELSARELEILYLIAWEELTTKQIAERLHRSIQTIETHRAHLFQKLDVASVVGLVKYAMSNGLCTNHDNHSGNA